MIAHPAPRVKSFQESAFCRRLCELSQAADPGSSLASLVIATQRLVEHAEAISAQIVRHLPQYTLHDQTHLWNVLSFMEELAGGDDGISRLQAGNCALAVWAAFLHDLGMAPQAAELAELDRLDGVDRGSGRDNGTRKISEARAQQYRSFRDSHELWNSICREPTSSRNDQKLGVIRADFIRDSHAQLDESNECRVGEWLATITMADRLVAEVLDQFGVTERVALVAVSHNQSVDWLERKLTSLGVDDPNGELYSELGLIHWTWIGWLLRLADIFDCDASRTPRIVFDAGAIDDTRSMVEWRKHLAIKHAPMWRAGSDQQTLIYECARCPSPAIEKALKLTIQGMNEEIENCRRKSERVPPDKKLMIHLPSRADVTVKAREKNYQYHDIEFRLERDSVIELLMGESLYGGSELALRELVQNALDAVHLRDQRNRLARAIEQSGSAESPRFPHQPWEAKSGQVDVTWGTEDDGRNWIEVADNGVGMTIEGMRRFLTQVGKSYYKSADFRAEQQLMRRHGILCTAIAQFGIGFLSVFMLADHVEIRTRPVGAPNTTSGSAGKFHEADLLPVKAVIDGPHGLISFYPDNSMRYPGTRVKLWLKPEFRLPKWDRGLLIAKLRREFYDERLEGDLSERWKAETEPDTSGQTVLDPAFVISSFVVWPLYPVHLSPVNVTPAIVLSDRFHIDELRPLNISDCHLRSQTHHEGMKEASNCAWAVCDWVDEQSPSSGAVGTGSRIRLVTPQPQEDISEPFTLSKLGGLADELASGSQRSSLLTSVEWQLPAARHRYQCLVNGVRVPGFVPERSYTPFLTQFILGDLPILPGVGSWLWIDLRGDAAPRLRADRSRPAGKQNNGEQLKSLRDRWLAAWPQSVSRAAIFAVQSAELRKRRVADLDHCRLGTGNMAPETVLHHLLAEFVLSEWAQSNMADWRPVSPRDPHLHQNLQHTEITLDHLSGYVRANPNCLASGKIDRERESRRQLAEVLAEYFDREFSVWRGDICGSLRSVIEVGTVCPNPENEHLSLSRLRTWGRFSQLHFLSESLWPSPAESLPALGWTGRSEQWTDFHVHGPLHLSKACRIPAWLEDYDLQAPLTAFALPRLRRNVPAWMTDRAMRLMFMLPFLAGREPLIRSHDYWSQLPGQRLMLFMPNRNHYDDLYDNDSPEKWSAGSASALWDFDSGRVLYADGIHTEDSLRSCGKPLLEWLGLPCESSGHA